jgi:hypothetical protein
MSLEIPKTDHLAEKVFSIHNDQGFESIALEVYHFQFHNNPLYRNYCQALGKHPQNVTRSAEIPFLPISFFKSHQVKTGVFEPELVFESSGTTGMQTSKHFVRSAAIYEKSFSEGFRSFFGDPASYCILGLLPSYLERSNSSLVYMVDHLVKKTNHPGSGFYLHDHDKLNHTLATLEKSGQPTILFGVSYALLDLGASHSLQLKNTSIVETGGMKGRRKEMSKQELYDLLQYNFDVDHVYSEYGMTELLSQAYAIDGLYTPPPWMKILLRDETDPLQIIEGSGKAGVINVIDLANIYSCSFIATEDAGRLHEYGFEVLGRVDHSDTRGCSLMLIQD